MYSTKVVYLESTFLKKTRKVKSYGRINGLALRDDLQALLLEEEQKGYELVNVSPITGNAANWGYPAAATVGLLVTLKKV